MLTDQARRPAGGADRKSSTARRWQMQVSVTPSLVICLTKPLPLHGGRPPQTAAIPPRPPGRPAAGAAGSPRAPVLRTATMIARPRRPRDDRGQRDRGQQPPRRRFAPAGRQRHPAMSPPATPASRSPRPARASATAVPATSRRRRWAWCRSVRRRLRRFDRGLQGRIPRGATLAARCGDQTHPWSRMHKCLPRSRRSHDSDARIARSARRPPSRPHGARGSSGVTPERSDASDPGLAAPGVAEPRRPPAALSGMAAGFWRPPDRVGPRR